jgi:AcrR family transcriptional regulator
MSQNEQQMRKQMLTPVQPGRARRRAGIGDRILSAALREMMRRGAAKVSMADVAEAARVSRTTLYKYFPIKEDLLKEVGAHIRSIFERELAAAIQGQDEPGNRLAAVLAFLRRFHEEWRAEQIIDLELGPIVEGIRINFDHYCELIAAALAPTFDALDRVFGHRVKRRLIAETLVRIQLSNAIIRLGRDWDDLSDSAAAAWDMLVVLASGAVDAKALTKPQRRSRA